MIAQAKPAYKLSPGEQLHFIALIRSHSHDETSFRAPDFFLSFYRYDMLMTISCYHENIYKYNVIFNDPCLLSSWLSKKCVWNVIKIIPSSNEKVKPFILLSCLLFLY